MTSRFKPKCGLAKPRCVASYAHAKLDGHFVRVGWKYTHITITTSRPTEISEQVPDHIYNQCQRLPMGTVALGELWVPNKPASYVKTALKNQDRTLQLTFFALEEDRNIDEDISTMSLPELLQWFWAFNLEFAPFETLQTGPQDESQLEHLRTRARSLGIEGWVLKTGNLTGWLKLKCENTIDLVITGVTEGKGKFLGQIGSVLCAADDGIELCAAGGMDDDLRADLTEMYDEGQLLGQVCEIEYQRVDSGGRLRHPRFVRLRDDKLASECTRDQDPDLCNRGHS